MTGTWINIATVLAGGGLGLLFGAYLPERARKTVIAGLGLFTAAIGLKMFNQSENEIIVLGSILVGGLLGEWGRIEDRLRGLGALLEKRFTRNPGTLDDLEADRGKTPMTSRFIQGFLTASLVFCVGPMTILGSIHDGLTGDYSLLAIKSVLDGFASLAFASTLGIGVLFSSLVILVYQGGLSLLAAQAEALVTQAMMNEMTATGGVILVGIAVSSLLELKPIRVGNFLPALFIAPVIVAILNAFP
jgi:uncharacterized membrane protein YqgA involved in biofilm formation